MICCTGGVITYLDDILVYTKDKKEHVRLVREVLQRLKDNCLFAKLPKCEFHKEEIDFLGYRISSQGVKMDPGKVQAVVDWAPPRTRKQLQSFLGFAGARGSPVYYSLNLTRVHLDPL